MNTLADILLSSYLNIGDACLCILMSSSCLAHNSTNSSAISLITRMSKSHLRFSVCLQTLSIIGLLSEAIIA
uniref:Uncharacterized protein n=1 Tax=Arundo donax TaxID=35708 RepID=A0A0A9D326_ARUDO